MHWLVVLMVTCSWGRASGSEPIQAALTNLTGTLEDDVPSWTTEDVSSSGGEAVTRWTLNDRWQEYLAPSEDSAARSRRDLIARLRYGTGKAWRELGCTVTSRGNLPEPLYAEEPGWLLLTRREQNPAEPAFQNKEDTFWVTRGRRQTVAARAGQRCRRRVVETSSGRRLKDALSRSYWTATRGRRSLQLSRRHSDLGQFPGSGPVSAQDTPFWVRRRTSLKDALAGNIAFWAARGRRDFGGPASKDDPSLTMSGRASFEGDPPSKKSLSALRSNRANQDILSNGVPFHTVRDERGIQDILSNADPFHAVRGKKRFQDVLPHEDPFHAAIDRFRYVSKGDPFDADRGRREFQDILLHEDPLHDVRGRKDFQDVLFKADPFLAVRGRRGINDLSSKSQEPFSAVRGRRGTQGDSLPARGRRKDDVQTKQDPFLVVRGTRELRNVFSNNDQFFAARGKRGRRDSLSERSPRGKRRVEEAISETEPREPFPGEVALPTAPRGEQRVGATATIEDRKYLSTGFVGNKVTAPSSLPSDERSSAAE